MQLGKVGLAASVDTDVRRIVGVEQRGVETGLLTQEQPVADQPRTGSGRDPLGPVAIERDCAPAQPLESLLVAPAQLGGKHVAYFLVERQPVQRWLDD